MSAAGHFSAILPQAQPHPRLHEQIAQLARFNSDPEAGGITREVYTAEYDASLAYVRALMLEVGLEARVDAAGNLIGRWQGSDHAAPAVLTGSHFDTTLNAGAYDGVVGVPRSSVAVGRRARAARARSGSPARSRAGAHRLDRCSMCQPELTCDRGSHAPSRLKEMAARRSVSTIVSATEEDLRPASCRRPPAQH